MIALQQQIDVTTIDKQFGMQTYGRAPVTFVKGKGTSLWDANGKRYLDLISGIGVCGLGHCHPDVSKAIADQASTLLHVSNLFHTELQPLLAEKLCALTQMDRAFFCNSGTEANEAAIKIARKWGRQYKGPNATTIVSLSGSFHGRTLGALAATAKPQYQVSFQPLPGGFIYTTTGAERALESAVGDNVCAVLLEPVQGEGGVHVLSAEFLQAARRICDEKRALLIADEVQCGMGRTGAFLACEHADVLPDVVTLAKGIANGVPMGACVARGDAANVLVPGDHGCTFGGNPLSCAAALAVLNALEREDAITNARQVGAYLSLLLQGLVSRYPSLIQEVRGVGLMIGIQLKSIAAKKVMLQLLEKGIVVGTAGDDVIRLLPPLILTQEECDHFVTVFNDLLMQMTQEVTA